MNSEQLIQDKGVELKSNRLQGKSIGVGVSGGIASVEIVKIIRELRRHDADITAFFTPSVQDFITPLPVAWACSKSVVTKVDADVEHFERFDLVLVAPATLNTINKAAIGLADNPVTMLIATQLGMRGPLVFVPTMNVVLSKHPIYEEHKTRLKQWGADFLQSPEEEGKLKMPPPEIVAEFVLGRLSRV